MVSQLFKKDIDNRKLWELLESICKKNDKYYLINKESFKRGSIFSKKINEFYDELSDYYHESKKYYVQDAVTYKKFCTIIRQLCKNNNILFQSKIKYMKSTYEIEYYIYYDPKL
jgi:hypothetical protein